MVGPTPAGETEADIKRQRGIIDAWRTQVREGVDLTAHMMAVLDGPTPGLRQAAMALTPWRMPRAFCSVSCANVAVHVRPGEARRRNALSKIAWGVSRGRVSYRPSMRGAGRALKRPLAAFGPRRGNVRCGTFPHVRRSRRTGFHRLAYCGAGAVPAGAGAGAGVPWRRVLRRAWRPLRRPCRRCIPCVPVA